MHPNGLGRRPGGRSPALIKPFVAVIKEAVVALLVDASFDKPKDKPLAADIKNDANERRGGARECVRVSV